MKLKGKVSLVSACGRGIGKEIALTLAREGSNLIINSFSRENTRTLEKEIAELGVEVVTVAGDITKSKVILETVNSGIGAFGRIDIVINNIGGGSASEVEDKDNPLAEVEAVWDGTYAMSLKAPVLMCEAVMPHLIEKKSGKIVNISSMAGRPGMPHVDLVPLSSSYHSSKAGLIRYTQLLQIKWGVTTSTSTRFVLELFTQMVGRRSRKRWSSIIQATREKIPENGFWVLAVVDTRREVCRRHLCEESKQLAT